MRKKDFKKVKERKKKVITLIVNYSLAQNFHSQNLSHTERVTCRHVAHTLLEQLERHVMHAALSR